MGRPLRFAQAGFVHHVLNRSNARLPLLRKDGNFAAFERVLAEAGVAVPVPVLADCLMPNHWHLLLWPQHDDHLSRFVGWLTLTHTQRWHAHYHNSGSGHVYQGRFQSFPFQDDEHLLRVCRSVERNAWRAGLVGRAEDWPWCSLGRRARRADRPEGLSSAWPVPRSADWVAEVNSPQTEGELAQLRPSAQRGRPLGRPQWVEATAARLDLQSTVRPLGRPRKKPKATGAPGHNNGP
jgi:putative transposase